ncbi:glycosyltransferase [Rugamonas sp.]|uniref:glycosyltransferase n=1 Tax=Rugamonas sp. TaxID=1926287 RepID=UPI0025F8FBD5|nr:glycosyltransferase [Rugamonas sp.]
MESQDIVLSICIPTHNRAAFLKYTLESIVTQAAFIVGNDVEIVISDNDSEDDTPAVAAVFVQAFPGKVRYYRHEEAVTPEANFESVLARGRGLYMKLHNDYLLVNDGSLAEIINVIHAMAEEKPVLFLTNGVHNQGNPIEVMNSMSDFVRRVSYISTWIGGFGMWREEFHALSDFGRNQQTRLVQTDVMLRLISMGKRAIVLFSQYFSMVKMGRTGGYKKGAYNIAEVFGQNYLSLLKPYVLGGALDRMTYEREKKLILLQHIIPVYFDTNNDYLKTGFFRYLHDYKDDDYFYEAVATLETDVPKRAAATPVLPHNATPEQQQAHWRALNTHNATTLARTAEHIDFQRVRVGRMSAGELRIITDGPGHASLSIGSFCSIAGDVQFLAGATAAHDGVSTFPLMARYFGEHAEAAAAAALVVGDDVRIGQRSMILSGVTIGQGAVVAPGSVVSADVAPYTIVGGNPAGVVGRRYDAAVVQKMLRLDYSKVSDAAILAHHDLLRQPLTIDNVDAIIDRLMAG